MFEKVVGQTEVKAQLESLVESGKMPHALLFSGAPGAGQLAMAVALAQEMLKTDRLLHPDLHYVFPVYKPKGWAAERKAVSDDFTKQWREQMEDSLYFDAQQWGERIGLEGQKFQIGVGESDQIIRKLSLVSAQGGWKVMIIWQAEKMSTEAANKLLKILEDPTPETLFILVAEHSEQLLETIVSRTQRFDFRPLAEDDVADVLMRDHGLSAADARQAAHVSGGNLTRAMQSLLTTDQEVTYFNLVVLLMRGAYARDLRGMRSWSETIAKLSRAEQRNFLQYMQRFIRENFAYNFREPQLCYMNDREREFAQRFARFINERNIIPFYEEISLAQRDVAQNTNSKMVFFDLALKVILLLRQ
ncbi:MAG: DNA polymerase III subunit delta [Bacteroidaceae bacterium]|nr:DNA polymerase III subunit delta [Bacteroidaceae bacterium]